MTSKRILHYNIGFIIILCLFNIANHVLYREFGYDHLLGFSRLVHFDIEGNLPSWFSTINLFIASILLFVISKSDYAKQQNQQKYWLVLTLIFIFMSFDENAMFHETIGEIILGITGPLADFTWLGTVPYMIAIPILLMFLYKFLFALKPYFRNMFVLCGFIFCLGALGFEYLGFLNFYVGPNSDNAGDSYTYLLMNTLEESLEMFGVVLFIFSLLRFTESNNIPLEIKLKTE